MDCFNLIKIRWIKEGTNANLEHNFTAVVSNTLFTRSSKHRTGSFR